MFLKLNFLYEEQKIKLFVLILVPVIDTVVQIGSNLLSLNTNITFINENFFYSIFEYLDFVRQGETISTF